jgi:hypothetical protein
MCPVKEPNYFAFPDGQPPTGPAAQWLRETSVWTRADYEALFDEAGNARAIGESSAGYLVAPEAAPRIYSLVPHARLVAILRNPVDRAYANYLAHHRDGYDQAPTFEAALDDQERRRRDGWSFASFLETGKYWRHLMAYRRVFPPGQLRIYLFDDLVRDPVALMRDLLTFIDVDPAWMPDMSRRHGQTGVIRNPVVRVLWARTERARRALRPFVPRAWRGRLQKRVLRDQVRPDMRPETRARLLDVYRDDMLKLQDLLGRDLSAWLRQDANQTTGTSPDWMGRQTSG